MTFSPEPVSPRRRVRAALVCLLGLGGGFAFLYAVPGEPRLHYPGAVVALVLASTLLCLYEEVGTSAGPAAGLLLTLLGASAMLGAFVLASLTGGEVLVPALVVGPLLAAMVAAAERMLRVARPSQGHDT